jgi:ketosteroid isomerase-like protein
MKNDLISIARKYYQSYVEKDRAGIEVIISDDFRFTSPWDNKINRAVFFERCWPNSEVITGFDLINLVIDGERAFVTYEGQSMHGKPFRNSEIMTIRNGKIIEIEVYFGWLIPHDAPAGGFVDPHTRSQSTGHAEDQAGARRS